MGNPANVSRNEGEGNKTADREYRKGATEHAQSQGTKVKAREAERALESEEREELEEAELTGKSRR